MRRRSLPREVADQLVELIAAAGADEVMLLPERRLSEQFGVSRGALREALAGLEDRGLIETRGKARIARAPRARALLLARLPAGSPERERILEPMEVRRILEPEIAAFAAARADESVVADLEGWIERQEAARLRAEPIVEYDAAFHVAIARATGNRMLVELVSGLADALRESREASFRPPEAVALAIADHRAIAKGIGARDGAAARAAMRAHLDRVGRLVARAASLFSESG